MRALCHRSLFFLFAGSLVAGLVSSVQAQPLSEQNLLPSPTPSVRFEHVTIEDGLSDNRINGLLHDSEGYMWFGSMDGLSRFDGYEFKSFWNDARDSTSLSGNYIEVLFEDHAKTMWVGTWGFGANRYDRETETFERFRHDPGDPTSLADDFVAAIVEDAEGNLWFGTQNGLSRFEAATGSFTTYRHDPEDDASLLHNIVRSLLVDREGVLWVGTGSQYTSPLDEGGLHRYDPATDSFVRYPGDTAGLVGHYVVALFEDRAGTLWMGTASGGLHRMDQAAGTFEPVAPALRAQGYLTFIHEDRVGHFWVGTASGVNLVDRETGTLASFMPDPTDPSSLSIGRVWRMYEDRSGTLWIGCGSAGCLEKVKTEPSTFRHHTLGPGVDSGSMGGYPPMYALRDGTLMMTTLQGVAMLDRRRGQIVLHPVLSAALPGTWVAFYEDSAGLIWAGGSRALLAYNPVTGQVKDYAPALFRPQENDWIWTINETPDGMIWLGMDRLTRFDRATDQFTRVETASRFVTDIHMNTDGTMWVGTWEGLLLFDPSTDAATRSLLDNHQVFVIHPAADGALWVAMAAGLGHVDPTSGTVRIYTRDDGLPNNTVVGIIEDEAGFLWLATRSGGISRFDPQEEVFLNFDRRDGLGGLSFYSAIKDQAGRLYFYGPHGVSEYVGGQSTTNPTPPEVRITGLTAKDRPVSLDATEEMQAVRLSRDENDLSIRFHGFHYDNPVRNQHRVRLDPLDASWVDPGTERQVRYPNLDPGTYTFRVRAANSDGVWSEEEATLRIIIVPPWWSRWWAYVLYGLIFFGGVFATDRFQRRRLIRKEREKAREREIEQAREIERAHTELQEAHSYLKTTQAQLIQSEKMASLGQLTAGIAHEIKNPLNFVNNFAELNTELADELRDEIRTNRGKPLDEVADDLEDMVTSLKINAAQIAKHGKRADRIVQSMMKHASADSKERYRVEVKAFVEEYINLAYQGKKTQVPDLEVQIKRDYDERVGTVEMAPQEMSRVLLNLLSNAFDAVHEKATKSDGGYRPEVRVTTHKVDGQVEIRVGDNGPGIPSEIRSKIFEPFFTTKPTGTGTGLGLSLSYDIVTQGHGGTLTVESKAGEGATFVITLPTDSRT